MISKSMNFFSMEYEARFSDILIFQLIILFIFRLLTLFISTKSLHNVNFITFNELLVIYTVLEIIVCILLFIKVPENVSKQKMFVSFFLINLFFAILYVEQFFLLNNPIVFYQDDILLIFLQLFIIIVLISASKSNFSAPKENINSINLSLFLSFFFLFFAKLFTNNEEISNILLMITNITFWSIMWSLIIIYTLKIKKVSTVKAILPFIGIIIGFGMFMGMTKTEVMKAVIITIIDQTFSMNVVNFQFFGYNPELILILINVITGFTFIFVLTTAIFIIKESKIETASLLILGMTGLSVIPILAIIRFLSLFKLELDFTEKQS